MIDALDVRGNETLLRTPPMGLLASTRTPVDLYLPTLQLVLAESAAGRTMVGPFHSPLERDSLEVILESGGSAIVCPARSLGVARTVGAVFPGAHSRDPAETSAIEGSGTSRCGPGAWRTAMSEGRLALASVFVGECERRPTVQLAERRNALVVELASALFIPHARPGTRTFDAAQLAIEQGKPVGCFDHLANRDLILLGAACIGPG